MEFKVKRDFLPIFITNLCLLFVLAVAICLGSHNAAVLTVVLILVATGIGIYNTCVIFASCNVDNETLTFRSGIFKYTIKLNQIVSVEHSKNAYASLALSFTRLRILTVNEEQKQKVYYISVEDNEKLASIIAPTKQVAAKPQPVVEEVKAEQQPEVVEVNATVEPKKAPVKKATTTKKAATAKKTTTTKKTTTATKKSTAAKKTTTAKKTTVKKTATKKAE